MRNKYNLLCVINIIIISLNINAQTYLTPHIGLNYNSYDYFNPYPTINITDLSGHNNYEIGIEVDHFVLKNFDIKLGGSYYIKKHSYIIEFIPNFFIPYYIENSKTWNYYFKSGYNIIDWLNIGIGYKKMIFFLYETMYIGGTIKESQYYNFDNLLFHLNLNYKDLVMSLNYSKAINNDKINIFTKYDTFELNFGYRITIMGHKK